MLDDYVAVSNIIPDTYCEKFCLNFKETGNIPEDFTQYIKGHIEESYIGYCQRLFRAKKTTPDILNLSEAVFSHKTKDESIDNDLTYFPQKEQNIVPVLSFIGVFNDDYSGSVVTILEKRIRLNAGDILIFPSSFVFKPEIESVTEGTIYYFTGFGY